MLGNHEDLVTYAAMFPDQPHAYTRELLRKNGGGWLDQLSPEEIKHHAEILGNVPIMLEIKTPAGRKVGIAHASVPYNDWEKTKGMLTNPGNTHPHKLEKIREHILWNREHVERFLYGNDTEAVANIDHVFFGHTPVKNPLRNRNCSWIDTKAYKSDKLTILEIDEWIEKTN